MSWLEIDEELLNNVEDEKVSEGGSVLPSGIYDVEIVQLYARQTDSGAVMIELEGKTEVEVEGKKEEKKIYYSNCIQSGDEKGNKTTYTDKKSGKEMLLPGVVASVHMFQSMGLDFAKATPSKEKVERGQGTIEAKVFKELRAKKFKACIRQYENEYNGEVSVKYDIENFLDTDGKNNKGESQTEKFLKKIEKSPIKKLKAKAGVTVPTASTAGVADSGW